jgi:hypothetical protein
MECDHDTASAAGAASAASSLIDLSEDAVSQFELHPKTIPYAGLTMEQLAFLRAAVQKKSRGTAQQYRYAVPDTPSDTLGIITDTMHFMRSFGRPPKREGVPRWMG